MYEATYAMWYGVQCYKNFLHLYSPSTFQKWGEEADMKTLPSYIINIEAEAGERPWWLETAASL